MDRKQYLEMCREVATIRDGVGGIKNVPDKLRVIYKDEEYYPVAYKLGFRIDGSATHTAILHEPNANAVWYVELDKVKQKEGVRQ